jgi:thiamine-phosphate diphosphorylase
MELIVITHPQMLPDEAAIVNELFAHGLTRLHVRKPEATEPELRALLEQIDQQFRNRIALHQHHALATALGITGLHFTESNRLAQSPEAFQSLKQNGHTLSTSLHEPADLEKLSHCFDYAFLGPVFDSISKTGYKAALASNFKLKKYGFSGKVIALGGINQANLSSIARMGFDGAAVLGTIWQNPENAIARFKNLKSPTKALPCPRFQPGDKRDRVHFISQENEKISHIESIRLALEAGCRWIQLRVKNRTEEEVLPLAWEAIRLCDNYGAKLIINDFPLVALAVDAYGLHLGLSDMPVPEARALVGDKMVIGGTANTWDDIVLRINEGADYIGFGPLRFTSTKQNLSPILGLEGYRSIMRQMAEQGYKTPIIAIGGITAADIAALCQSGVYGVAMSSSLIAAEDPQKTFYQIQQALC